MIIVFIFSNFFKFSLSISTIVCEPIPEIITVSMLSFSFNVSNPLPNLVSIIPSNLFLLIFSLALLSAFSFISDAIIFELIPCCCK